MFWGRFACDFRFQISPEAFDELVDYRFWASVFLYAKWERFRKRRAERGGAERKRMIEQMGQNSNNQ